MADTTFAKPVLSVCATTASKIKDLTIKDGQLIFAHDTGRIALDFNSKRTFYNQIIELNTEQERVMLLAPVSGKYYFVIETAVLWTYQSDWVQITTLPEEVVFIGTTLQELGSKKTLYINKESHNVSVWDEDSQKYIVVGEKIHSVTESDIELLFS